MAGSYSNSRGVAANPGKLYWIKKPKEIKTYYAYDDRVHNADPGWVAKWMCLSIAGLSVRLGGCSD